MRSWILAALVLVACSSDASTTAIAEAKSALGRNVTPNVPAADQATLAADNEAFALAAYAALAKSMPSSNVFFSPYSISSVFAMTYAGANGQTATEMASALHFTLPQAQLHPAFDAVDLALRQPTPGFTLHLAN